MKAMVWRRGHGIALGASLVAAGVLSASIGAPSGAAEGGVGPTTLAGTGAPGFAGDGGPAAAALLREPSGIAQDRMGDLFIADAGNCRVREVPARGGDTFGRTARAVFGLNRRAR